MQFGSSISDHHNLRNSINKFKTCGIIKYSGRATSCVTITEWFMVGNDKTYSTLLTIYMDIQILTCYNGLTGIQGLTNFYHTYYSYHCDILYNITALILFSCF